jgi:hypothetical protein
LTLKSEESIDYNILVEKHPIKKFKLAFENINKINPLTITSIVNSILENDDTKIYAFCLIPILLRAKELFKLETISNVIESIIGLSTSKSVLISGTYEAFIANEEINKIVMDSKKNQLNNIAAASVYYLPDQPLVVEDFINAYYSTKDRLLEAVEILKPIYDRVTNGE